MAIDDDQLPLPRGLGRQADQGRGEGERARTLPALALAAAALLGACTVGPDYVAPSPWSPASWFGRRPEPPKLASLPVAEPVDPDWWTVFNDPILTGLMRRVAASNLDVRTADIRLAESRAQRGVTAAAQFANLHGNASYTREYVSPRGVIGLLGGSGGSSTNGSGTGTQTSSNGTGGTVGGIPSGALGAGSSGGGTRLP